MFQRLRLAGALLLVTASGNVFANFEVDHAPKLSVGVNHPTTPTEMPGAYPTQAQAAFSTFLQSSVNPDEKVSPDIPRKAAFWCAYAAVAGGVALFENSVGLSQYVSAAARYENLLLMGVCYAYTPLVTAFVLASVRYPELVVPVVDKEGEMSPSGGTKSDSTKDVATVIPCHNSAGEIANTLRACLKHMEPSQIFVVDNGNSKEPLDDTEAKVREVHPLINYLWLPMGNKNIAQYAGTMAAKDYKYIMTVDDDVILPDNFDFGTHLIDEETKAVCFPCRPAARDGKPSILIEWQDIEYKIADCVKNVEGRFCGVLFPHGAASLWERETFIEALKLHDTVFYAEDVKLGFALQQMGKKMAFSLTTPLTTYAPTTLFGQAPNYYQQRVHSWEMGRQIYYLKFLRNFLAPSQQKTFAGTAVMKAFQGLSVINNTMDWIQLPLLVCMANNPSYWIKTGAFSAAITVPLLVWNYSKISKRPDLKSSLTAIMTYPAYKVLYSAASVCGAIRSLAVYWPNFQQSATIQELEGRGDERCIWLRATQG